MIEEEIDFMDAARKYDVICIPTNGVIKPGGVAAVMGGGVAALANEHFENIDLVLGRHLQRWGNVPGFLGYYAPKTNKYFTPESRAVYPAVVRIWSFPTKEHWRLPSEISIIVRSAKLLDWELRHITLERVAIPRPGCGLGGLPWELVREHLVNIFDDRYVIIDRPRTAKRNEEQR